MHCKPDLTPFYVGKGVLKRCYEFTRRNVHHKNIIAKYGCNNIQIIVTKKDSEESAFKSEIRLIKILRDAGFDLCNQTDGGEGTCGIIRSPETRAKMSAVQKGKPKSAESRAKMSAAKIGKKRSPHSAETRAKMSTAHVGMTGKKQSSEARAKISAARKGKLKSAETRAKMSAAKTGKKCSLETRTKISATKAGKRA